MDPDGVGDRTCEAEVVLRHVVGPEIRRYHDEQGIGSGEGLIEQGRVIVGAHHHLGVLR